MTFVHHLLSGCLGVEKEALEVDIQYLVPKFLGHLQHGCKRVDTGVVDQDIQPSEGLQRFLNCPPGVCDAGGIGIGRICLAPFGADLIDRVICSFQVDISDHHRSACLRQSQSDALTYSHRSTSNDGRFSCQIEELRNVRILLCRHAAVTWLFSSWLSSKELLLLWRAAHLL